MMLQALIRRYQARLAEWNKQEGDTNKKWTGENTNPFRVVANPRFELGTNGL